MSENDDNPVPAGDESVADNSSTDTRLYVTSMDDMQAKVKADWTREYCYEKRPNEDHFHLIVGGEIYLQRGQQKICLDCASKRGLITRDRTSWQR